MPKVARAILISVLLITASTGAAVGVLHRRVKKFGETPIWVEGKAPSVRVQIPRGVTTGVIGQILEQSGIITNARHFYFYARFIRHADTLLRPGEYDLSPALTPEKVIQKLLKGDVVTYRFTIPEGSSLKDIARIVGASKLAPAEDMLKIMGDVDFVRSQDIPTAQDTLEGYLFPDTYVIPAGLSAGDILRMMRQRAAKVMTPELVDAGQRVGLNPHQILTLASIVEKETGKAVERPLISAVFHNRLKLGMKLQTDPTVAYGIPDYAGNLTRKHLETPHPYNTYVIHGLPPGPIASPGKAALEAAVSPANVKWLFFVSQNDGTHVFCETLSCHNKNVKKWQVDFFKDKRAVATKARKRRR